MGVIPVDEIGGTVRAVEVDARNVQVSILDCASRENHCVVVLFEVIEGDVGAVLDVAEEANVAAVENLVERTNNALNARMVGGDAITNQTVWRWQ